MSHKNKPTRSQSIRTDESMSILPGSFGQPSNQNIQDENNYLPPPIPPFTPRRSERIKNRQNQQNEQANIELQIISLDFVMQTMQMEKTENLYQDMGNPKQRVLVDITAKEVKK
ncbi:hypothetical protein BB560_004532 [Smittium megazygosporum]|uniref:Uncharacterized protein n=1 Tax=Smittium megazygosporum TaxID=133381 RepID=A0A2T9Z8Z8_9FUNG|nr:hypothetical protein BB560_004532 [Smittium megazygosporum]